MVRRTIAVVVFALLVGTLALVAPAGATVPPGAATQLLGSGSGVSMWGTAPRCNTVHQFFDMSYGAPQTGKTVALHIEACESSSAPTVGSYRFRAANGTLSGSLRGTLTITGPVTFDFVLHPVTGTGAFAGVRRNLHFRAVWNIGTPSGSPFTAAVTLQP